MKSLIVALFISQAANAAMSWPEFKDDLPKQINSAVTWKIDCKRQASELSKFKISAKPTSEDINNIIETTKSINGTPKEISKIFEEIRKYNTKKLDDDDTKWLTKQAFSVPQCFTGPVASFMRKASKAVSKFGDKKQKKSFKVAATKLINTEMNRTNFLIHYGLSLTIAKHLAEDEIISKQKLSDIEKRQKTSKDFAKAIEKEIRASHKKLVPILIIQKEMTETKKLEKGFAL